MKYFNRFRTAMILFCLFASGVPAQSGGNFTVTQSVIASGGGQNSSGAGFTLAGTIGQSNAGTQSSGAGFRVGAGFWAVQPLAPTAAQVSIGGRVLTADGSGIRNARVILTASDGVTRSVSSSTFGYYRFEAVPVGETYVISVISQRFTFAQPTIVRAVFDNLSDLDFIAFGL